MTRRPESTSSSLERTQHLAKVLFKNVNVLDCTGTPPFAGQVLVEGNRIKAMVSLVPEAVQGDRVLVHAGLAITVMSEDEAQETLTLMREKYAVENE